MTTIPQVRIEEDRPPVGTPCIVCKGKGHWCQAEQFTAGDSGNGICNACVEGNECSHALMRKKRDLDDFIPTDSALLPEPVRVIPAPQAVVVQPKPVIQLAAPAISSQSDGDTRRFEAIAQRLLKLEPGETVAFAVPEGRPAKGYEGDLLRFLATDPRTMGIDWIHHASESDRRVVMATMKKLKGVTRVKAEPPAAGLCGCGRDASHKGRCAARRQELAKEVQDNGGMKADMRRMVEGMLANDYSPRLIAKRTGLAEKSIERVQAEMAARVPVSNVAPPPAKPIQATNGSRPQPVTVEEPKAAEKPVLSVATPVTIVTVESEAPKPDLTLSRAFELVIAEMEASVDSMRDTLDDSEDMAACIKSHEALVGELRGWHPAQMGSSASGTKTSIYERAMDQAEAELRIIDLEIQRLEMRGKALKPMLEAMKTSMPWERESR